MASTRAQVDQAIAHAVKPPEALLCERQVGRPAGELLDQFDHAVPRRYCNVSCDIKYHARRAIEEADLAQHAPDTAGRVAHEGLAYLHLRAASDLRRQLQDMIAPRVD